MFSCQRGLHFEVLWIPEEGTSRVWDLGFYRVFEDWELAASYSLLHLVFFEVIGGILFVGGSKVMGSLTPDLFTFISGCSKFFIPLEGCLETKDS